MKSFRRMSEMASTSDVTIRPLALIETGALVTVEQFTVVDPC